MSQAAPHLADLGRLLYQVLAGGVQRWHAEPVTAQQTVAQHSFNVVLVLMTIVPAQELTRNLLLAALLHDTGEIATGDIPKQTRWALGPQCQSALDRLELLARRKAGMMAPELAGCERQYLHAADHIEAYLFALFQLSAGNQLALRWVDRLQQTERDHAYISSKVTDLYRALRYATDETIKGQAGVLRALDAAGFGE